MGNAPKIHFWAQAIVLLIYEKPGGAFKGGVGKLWKELDSPKIGQSYVTRILFSFPQYFQVERDGTKGRYRGVSLTQAGLKLAKELKDREKAHGTWLPDGYTRCEACGGVLKTGKHVKQTMRRHLETCPANQPVKVTRTKPAAPVESEPVEVGDEVKVAVALLNEVARVIKDGDHVGRKVQDEELEGLEEKVAALEDELAAKEKKLKEVEEIARTVAADMKGLRSDNERLTRELGRYQNRVPVGRLLSEESKELLKRVSG